MASNLLGHEADWLQVVNKHLTSLMSRNSPLCFALHGFPVMHCCYTCIYENRRQRYPRKAL